MSVKHIVEGWRNYLVPPKDMKELIEATYQERLEICNSCEYNSKNKNPNALFASCTHCGCPLSSKLRALTVSCPLPEPKWGLVLTPEEREAMEKTIKNQNNGATNKP